MNAKATATAAVDLLTPVHQRAPVLKTAEKLAAAAERQAALDAQMQKYPPYLDGNFAHVGPFDEALALEAVERGPRVRVERAVATRAALACREAYEAAIVVERDALRPHLLKATADAEAAVARWLDAGDAALAALADASDRQAGHLGTGSELTFLPPFIERWPELRAQAEQG